MELGKYAEDYGKYYLVRWKELGNKPAKRFYERVLEVSNPSDAATEARARLKKIKLQDDDRLSCFTVLLQSIFLFQDALTS